MSQTINVDMTPNSFQPSLYYSQGDIGREFKIKIVSQSGDTIPAGATVTIQATKPSGFGFSVAADSVTDGVATFTTTAVMTDEFGRFPAELKVVSGSVTIFSANFQMVGERNTHPEGTIDGQQGTIIPELTVLVERVEAAASSVLDMTVNATTLAAGSQATYSYDEDTNTATFGIPQGEAGAGAAGVVASAYSASKTYAVGDYVIHNSNLYRCTTAITTAEAFTAAHWTQVVLGDDVTDLKSDLDDLSDRLSVSWESGGIGSADGTLTEATTRIRTSNYHFKSISRVAVPSGYKYIVAAYANETVESYIGMWTGSSFQKNATWLTKTTNLSLAGNYYYKIILAKTNDGAISDSDASNIYLFDNTDKTLTKANKAADAKVTGEKFGLVDNDIAKLRILVSELWESGGIGSADGALSESTSRIRTANYISKGVSRVFASNGYKYIVAAYEDVTTASYIGMWNGNSFQKSATWLTDITNLSLAGDYYYKLVLAKVDDSIIAPEDATSLSLALYAMADKTLSHEGKAADAKATGDRISALELSVDVLMALPPNALWESGGIGSADGAYSISSTRIRTRNCFTDINTISAEEGYKYLIAAYDDATLLSYIGMWNGTQFVKNTTWLTGITSTHDFGNHFYRFVLAKENDEPISETDGINFSYYVSEAKSITGLPVLELTGNISGTTKENAVTLNYRLFGESGTCEVKWQGASSLRYQKKNYTIKFSNSLDGWFKWASFVNSYRASTGNISTVPLTSRWGNQKKFVAKANWIDSSMARNIVCARLWGQIVKSRVDKGDITDKRADAPNYGAIDGFPIDIKINGVDYGLYTFNIPKDKWTFAMGDGEAEYVVCGEGNYNLATQWKALATITEDVDYSLEYAPDEVDVETVASSLNVAIQAAINAHENWESELANYVDIDSVFDYFIFTCCVNNHDALARNIIYGTYDGVKWFLSAYDMDTTFGVDPYGSMWFDVVNDRNQFAQAATMHRLAYLMHKYSKSRLKERYWELRNGILSDENVWHEFSQFVVNIPSRDYEINNGLWSDMPGTATANVSQYMDYYRMHCAYLDAEIDAL